MTVSLPSLVIVAMYIENGGNAKSRREGLGPCYVDMQKQAKLLAVFLNSKQGEYQTKDTVRLAEGSECKTSKNRSDIIASRLMTKNVSRQELIKST